MKYSSILYVDFQDEKREYYQSLLKSYAKQVYVVDNHEDACFYYKEYNPDIVIIELLVENAVNWVKTIRKKDREIIILALTEDSSATMLKEVVELYFSDYWIKPVSEEVIRNTLMKVSDKLKQKQNIELLLDCQWNLKSKSLLCGGKKIFLTPRESRLFEFLVRHRDKFCSDDDIYYDVWKDELDKTISTASIRTLIKNLRRKIPEGLIINRYGLGYKIII